MKITTENINALKPCKNRFDNFKSRYPNYKGSLIDFLNLDNITYNDKAWVFARLVTHMQNVRWSILCADSVLQNYESTYPSDNRPRKAIEAAKAFILNPSEENRKLADARSAAARSAANYAATSAAHYTAAYAARSAARSAYFAAYDADSAAAAAANSARYAAADYADSAEKTQQELNLQFMVLAVS